MLSYFSLSDISLVLDFAVSEPTFPLAVSGSPIAGLLFAAVAAEKSKWCSFWAKFGKN